MQETELNPVTGVFVAVFDNVWLVVVHFFAVSFVSIKTIIIGAADVLSVFNIDSPEDLVLWLLSVSSVVFILSKLGWMPARISRAINRNQKQEISAALKQLGIKEDEVRSRFRAAKMRPWKSGEVSRSNADTFLEVHKIKKKVFVGKTNPIEGDHFFDVMGATTNPNKALQAAQLLSGYIRTLSKEVEDVADFDYVATPKSGSPLLGYEFARLVEKPLLLHSLEPKYRSTEQENEAETFFDFDCEIVPGKRVLIVDDSSTGGRKVAKLAKNLRDLRLEVNYCVVLFEPMSKEAAGQNAAAVLNGAGVILHSVCKK